MRTYPTEAKTLRKNDIFALKQLMPYLWQMRGRIGLSLLLLILAKIANVAVPVSLKAIIDDLDSTNLLVILPLSALFAYGALRLSSALFNELRDALFAKVRYNTMRLVAINLFEKLHQLDLSFHLNRKTGAITRDIDRGRESISSLLSILIFNILPSLFEVLLVIGLLFVRFEATFALIALSTVLLYLLITFFITTWRMQYRYDMNLIESEANNKTVDSLINYETIKYFNQEENEIKRYNNTMHKWQTMAIKSFTSMTLLNFVQSMVIAIGVTILLIFSAQSVINKTISLGDMIMIQALLLQLFLPLGTLGIVYRQIKHNLIDMNNMFSLLQQNKTICDSEQAPNLVVSKGEVSFNKVHFHYEANKTTLRDVNFNVHSKQKIAVVGHSGAGKSTITKLLFRFYDVNQGSITIDNQDIRHVNQHSLRQAIGVVPQDAVMFNDSIFYNIAYAKPNATLDEVRHIAKIAFIDDFIQSLPNQYDTLIGERGLKLSGGERQRIAIARVLLKNPPILIFDEATSSLDSYAEHNIQQALNQLAENHTTLVIAHRLSTVIDADSILVLDQGRIVEMGNHQTLLQKNGHYAQLWKLQQKDRNNAV